MVIRAFKTFFPRFEIDEKPSISCNSSTLDDLLADIETKELSGVSDCSSDEDEEKALNRPSLGLSLSNHKPKKQCLRRTRRNRITKEDEDVAVFLALTEKMSVSSLLFILQDHASQMHNIQQGQLQIVLSQNQSILSKPSSESNDLSAGNEGDSFSTSSRNNKKLKKFRFADIMGGQQVRVEVREIPLITSAEDKATLWWGEEDMMRTRQEALRIVRFYEQHRCEFATSITVLAESYRRESSETLVEHHMKKLSMDSVARGLESHLVHVLCISRVVAVQTVLLEQVQCRENKAAQAFAASAPRKRKDRLRSPTSSIRKVLSSSSASLAESEDQSKKINSVLDDGDADRIRCAYLEASRPCRTLALKMAQWDHVEALKASLSSWVPPRDHF